GNPCVMSATPNFLAFDENGGTQTTIVIPGGEPWEINTAVTYPWLTFSPSGGTGLGNQLVTITCAPNTTTSGRLATLILQCGISGTGSVMVAQNGQAPEPPKPCSGPYATLPSSQSFESSIGPWVQDPNDDFDWSIGSGSTPSNNTGPSSAFAGSNYAFTEASGSNHPYKTANLISPCLDLSETLDPSITYAYHMSGSRMGNLKLQVSSNNGNSWMTLRSYLGAQGEDWLTETVSLNNFREEPIQLRFNGFTGNGFTSDMAIDAISISPGGGCFDPYEVNNSFETAYSTGTGSFYNLPNACIAPGEDDYFRFLSPVNYASYYVRVRGKTPEVTGDYRLTMTRSGNIITIETHPENGSTTDTYLHLYGPEGNQLAANDNGGVGLFSRIVITISGFSFTPDRGGNRANVDQLRLTNTPNPFSEQTLFAFQLEQASEVSLTISNINGQVIARPIEANRLRKGHHEISFDGRELPTGVYVYTLQTQTGRISKQMVIAR
ncbi:MAG: T9SS type A sorting domain-containing protein, partial [Bacteroidota bacterium]